MYCAESLERANITAFPLCEAFGARRSAGWARAGPTSRPRPSRRRKGPLGRPGAARGVDPASSAALATLHRAHFRLFSAQSGGTFWRLSFRHYQSAARAPRGRAAPGARGGGSGWAHRAVRRRLAAFRGGFKSAAFLTCLSWALQHSGPRQLVSAWRTARTRASADRSGGYDGMPAVRAKKARAASRNAGCTTRLCGDNDRCLKHHKLDRLVSFSSSWSLFAGDPLQARPSTCASSMPGLAWAFLRWCGCAGAGTGAGRHVH